MSGSFATNKNWTMFLKSSPSSFLILSSHWLAKDTVKGQCYHKGKLLNSVAFPKFKRISFIRKECAWSLISWILTLRLYKLLIHISKTQICCSVEVQFAFTVHVVYYCSQIICIVLAVWIVRIVCPSLLFSKPATSLFKVGQRYSYTFSWNTSRAFQSFIVRIRVRQIERNDNNVGLKQKSWCELVND